MVKASDFVKAKKAANIAVKEMRSEHQSTYDHSRSVEDLTYRFMCHFASKYHFSRSYINQVTLAALTHDIGKMGVPEEIISATHKLSDEEFSIMHSHDQMAATYMPTEHTPLQMEVALNHHKNYHDGISLAAEIVAVADVYSALTEARSYKRTFSQQEALSIMLTDLRNSNLNPVLVKDMADFKYTKYRNEITESLSRQINSHNVKRNGQIVLFQYSEPDIHGLEQKLFCKDRLQKTNDLFDFCGFQLYPGMWYGMDLETNELVATDGTENGADNSYKFWRMDNRTNIWTRDDLAKGRSIEPFNFFLSDRSEKLSFPEWSTHASFSKQNLSHHQMLYESYLIDQLPRFVLGHEDHADKNATPNLILEERRDELKAARQNVTEQIHPYLTYTDVHHFENERVIDQDALDDLSADNEIDDAAIIDEPFGH